MAGPAGDPLPHRHVPSWIDRGLILVARAEGFTEAPNDDLLRPDRLRVGVAATSGIAVAWRAGALQHTAPGYAGRGSLAIRPLGPFGPLFRGVTAAAPLKHVVVGVAGLALAAFRGLTAAASLKPGFPIQEFGACRHHSAASPPRPLKHRPGGTPDSPWVFPRPHRRGLVTRSSSAGPIPRSIPRPHRRGLIEAGRVGIAPESLRPFPRLNRRGLIEATHGRTGTPCTSRHSAASPPPPH